MSLSFRNRLNAEACLKHSWICSISESGPDRNLSANKQNLKNVATNNNYYLFDASTKTMSMASTHEDLINEDEKEWEWEWEEDEDSVSFCTVNFIPNRVF